MISDQVPHPPPHVLLDVPRESWWGSLARCLSPQCLVSDFPSADPSSLDANPTCPDSLCRHGVNSAFNTLTAPGSANAMMLLFRSLEAQGFGRVLCPQLGAQCFSSDWTLTPPRVGAGSRLGARPRHRHQLSVHPTCTPADYTFRVSQPPG